MYNCPAKHPNFTLCLSLSLSFCLIMCWVPNLITNFRFQQQVLMSIPTTSHQYLSCIASWLHTGSSLSLMCLIDPPHLSHSCPKVVSKFSKLISNLPQTFLKVVPKSQSPAQHPDFTPGLLWVWRVQQTSAGTYNFWLRTTSPATNSVLLYSSHDIVYLELVWQSDASLFAIARALLVKHIFYSPMSHLNLDYLNCETAFGRVGKAAVRRRSAAHYSEHTVVFVPWRF